MPIRILKNEHCNSDGSYFEFDTDADILGEGEMGRVYLGKRIDKNGGVMYVAIKAMFECLPEQVIERSRREASTQIQKDSLVKITESGCPSIEYPFEMVFTKPAPKSKDKSVNVTVNAVRRKNQPTTPVQQPKSEPIFVPK